MNRPVHPVTVYFDSTCALCSAEFTGGPAPRDALMTAIQAVDARGRLFVGVPAIRICRTAAALPGGSFLLAGRAARHAPTCADGHCGI